MYDQDLILPTNYLPTNKEFLEALRIKSSGLGAQLFTNVHRQFFISSTDLRVEYEKYYCVEYPTLRSYLELAHEIYLNPGEIDKKHILKIKSPSGVVDEAYDDNVMEIVIDCIEKLEAANED